MEPEELLRKIPLFSSLPAEQRAILASLLRRRTIRRGVALFRKGDEGTALYMILRGRIRISLPAPQGDEVTLAVLQEGDFFGEMALLDGLPRSADAVAMEESTVQILNRTDFLAFVNGNGQALQAVLYALSQRLRRTDDLIAEISFTTLSSRLAKRLAELARVKSPSGEGAPLFDVRITQKDLAGLLGVARESVNKELRVLRGRGIVSTSRHAIIIRNLDQLKKRIR